MANSNEEVNGKTLDQLDAVDSIQSTDILIIKHPGNSYNSNKVTFSDLKDKILEEVEVPTKVSELENDSGYLVPQDVEGKQDTIEDLDTIRSGAQAGATALQSGANVSELENDAGYLTGTNAYTKDEVDALIPEVPTNVSSFTNDAGYLTQQDVSGKADKSDTYTKEEVNELIPEVPIKGISIDGQELYPTSGTDEVNIGTLGAIGYDSSSGGLYLRADDETVTVKNFGTMDDPDYKLATVRPQLPELNGASDGDVATYDESSDSVIWKSLEPASELPDIPNDHVSKDYVLGINSQGEPAWVQLSDGSGSTIHYYGTQTPTP